MVSNQTTDSQQELLTQVDEHNNVIGPIPRGIAHNSPNCIYRTVYIIVKNDEDKILLQKRSSSKDLYPDCWDLSVGGHVEYGQSYEDTAVKEIQEELGITTTAKDLKFIGEVLVKLPSSNEFFQVFEYRLKQKDSISLAIDEVSSTQWMTINEIKESMQTQKLKWYPRPLQAINKLY